MKPITEVDSKQLKDCASKLNATGVLTEKIRTVGVSKQALCEAFVEAIDGLDDDVREQLATDHVDIVIFYNDLIADEVGDASEAVDEPTDAVETGADEGSTDVDDAVEAPEAEATAAGTVVAPEPPAEAEPVESPAPAPTRGRRRATAQAQTENGPTPEVAAPPAAPRRGRRAGTAATPVEPEAPAPEVVEAPVAAPAAPPRRGRRAAAQAPVEAVAETPAPAATVAEAVAEAPKRKRGRQPAAPVEAPAEPVAAPAEAPAPKRVRRAATQAVPSTATDTVQRRLQALSRTNAAQKAAQQGRSPLGGHEPNSMAGAIDNMLVEGVTEAEAVKRLQQEFGRDFGHALGKFRSHVSYLRRLYGYDIQLSKDGVLKVNLSA